MTKIFNAISELEAIKHRYHKEIDDIMISKFKMVDIDIRKIDESLKNGGENLSEFFEKLSSALSGFSSKQNKEIQTGLNNDPDYKL